MGKLGNTLALQMFHFEEVSSFRKKDAEVEKRLIFHKVQTRFSHVRQKWKKLSNCLFPAPKNETCQHKNADFKLR